MTDPLYRRRPGVLHRVIDDEGLVLRQHEGEVLGLNEVAAAVLDRLDGSTGVDAIIDTLAPVYDVDRAELERDVRSFVEALLSAGVIEDAGGGD